MPAVLMRPAHLPRACLATLLLAAVAALAWQPLSLAQAQQTAAQPRASTSGTVIYRCTDAAGAVSMQNDVPCPKGSRQERRVIAPAASFPAFATPAAPAPVAPAAAAAPEARPPASEASPPARPEIPVPAALAEADRLPPPPIFKCMTWDNDSYLSEDPEPKPRCVALDTGGVGQACEMKYDQCARVPDGAACAGWTQRQREIESSWRHADGAGKPPLQDAFARVSRILSDTTCAR